MDRDKSVGPWATENGRFASYYGGTGVAGRSAGASNPLLRKYQTRCVAANSQSSHSNSASSSGLLGMQRGGCKKTVAREVYLAGKRDDEVVDLCSPNPCEDRVALPRAGCNAAPGSSAGTSSSNLSHSPSELSLVEREIKELLEGYRTIVNTACCIWERPDAALASAEVPLQEPGAPSCQAKQKSERRHGAGKTSSVPAAEEGGSERNKSQEACGIGAKRACDAGDAFCSRDNSYLANVDTSLPVSSVRGDRSTEANTSTVHVHGQPGTHVPSNVGCGESAVEVSDMHGATPPARASSPIDLFAEAFTEDQLSRSFDPQWQHHQQERRRKMIMLHQQPPSRGGMPPLQSLSTNPGLRFCSNSPLLMDAIEITNNCTVDYNRLVPSCNDVVDPTWGNRAESPVPLLVGGRLSGDHRVIGNSSNNNNNYSGDNSNVSLCNVSAGHKETSVLRRSGGDGYAESDAIDYHPNGGLASSLVYRVSPMTKVRVPPSEDKQRLSHLDVSGMVSSPLNEKTPSSLKQRQSQMRSFSSGTKGKRGDSTTPEIATSAQRTENYSMRSCAVSGEQRTVPDDAQSLGDCRHFARFETLEGMAGQMSSDKRRLHKPCDAMQPQYEQLTMDRSHHLVPNRKKRCCSRRRHISSHNAVTRFHENVERCVAAVESNSRTMAALPAFADSLVGAAISDLFPAVKRRQAQLKQFQRSGSSPFSTTPVLGSNARGSQGLNGYTR
ncbi:hypothetical protein ERJ75_001325600 [Trypanosoma vivax]|uniref:Uncharacterized protein n=1 Tax=Trypanosoma vivax (strain Y486) TaxID=1055687 RepID=G0U106_TRYVY|nr:hypothetical protein TRVL_00774 [Trypanosoma vivax]KAH8607995.1 hypothetical protein ERJ75_001325600 [Trypanosoma vivax]CCC49761.1 conserved hypothetical protein [Trypanosoma vivax Y486]